MEAEGERLPVIVPYSPVSPTFFPPPFSQVSADVQVCDTSIIIPNVNAEDLTAMQQFEVDTDVALGSWLGQVCYATQLLPFLNLFTCILKDHACIPPLFLPLVCRFVGWKKS